MAQRKKQKSQVGSNLVLIKKDLGLFGLLEILLQIFANDPYLGIGVKFGVKVYFYVFYPDMVRAHTGEKPRACQQVVAHTGEKPRACQQVVRLVFWFYFWSDGGKVACR